MATILDLETFRKTKTGIEYVDKLKAMDLLDVTQEAVNLGRILRAKGNSLSQEERLAAKLLFEHVKNISEKDSNLYNATIVLLKFYGLED